MHRLCLMLAVALLAVGCGEADSASEDATNASAPEFSRTSPTAPTAPTTRAAANTAANSAAAPSTAPATRPAGSADDGADEGIPLEKLTGTWVAKGVEVPEPGTVDITLTFRDDGTASVEADSNVPFVGEVKDATTKFRLNNGKVIAPGLRDGVKMPLRFEGQDTLILEYRPGKTVRFHRTSDT